MTEHAPAGAAGGSSTTPPLPAPLAPRRIGPREYVGAKVLKLGRSVSRFVRRTMLSDRVPRDAYDPPIDEIGSPVPVVFYFAEPPLRIYQVKQWLPVIERIQQDIPVVIVTRTMAATRRLREETPVPVHYARSLDALTQTYVSLDPKVIVYCNNGMKNFQSLIYRRALHVHVNHGESDKIVMASHQANAYDKVAVAGEAAIERYRSNLLHFDRGHFVEVGRPQLDIDTPSELPNAPPGTRTVLYAPTWQGEDATSDYSSVDVYGAEIVGAALSLPHVRVVYKPHPRTLTATEPTVEVSHRQIVSMLQAANDRDGAELHLMPFDANVLGTFSVADVLVTDLSSVGLDFLYLRPDAPIVMTDRFSAPDALHHLSPLSMAVDVIDTPSRAAIRAILTANLDHDPREESRLAMSQHYFGVGRGQSTAQFLVLLHDMMAERDILVAELDRERGPDPMGDSFERDLDERAEGDSVDLE